MGIDTVITTERLVLRHWRESDAEALFRYASAPDVGPAAGWRPHRDVEDSRSIIRSVLQGTECYAIVIADRTPADEAVGAISLMQGPDADNNPATVEVELGYWIGVPFWGQGYVPEAARALIRRAFTELGCTAIWAGYYEGNERSRRVLGKVGFTPHHTERDYERPQLGDRVTRHATLLTREQWELGQKADPTAKSYVDAQQQEAEDLSRELPLISYVRSGGQTGADRGGLDAARACGVPICGWCPPGGLAEDMPEPPGVMALYPELREGEANGYVERTALNVRDSHATLVVAPGGLEPRSGTEMTVKFARDYGRPVLVAFGEEDIPTIRDWLRRLGRGLTLNVAGPRESKLPGIHDLTQRIVEALLQEG